LAKNIEHLTKEKHKKDTLLEAADQLWYSQTKIFVLMTGLTTKPKSGFETTRPGLV